MFVAWMVLGLAQEPVERALEPVGEAPDVPWSTDKPEGALPDVEKDTVTCCPSRAWVASAFRGAMDDYRRCWAQAPANVPGAPARRTTLRITVEAKTGVVREATVTGDPVPDCVVEVSEGLTWTPLSCEATVHIVYPLLWVADGEPIGR